MSNQNNLEKTDKNADSSSFQKEFKNEIVEY